MLTLESIETINIELNNVCRTPTNNVDLKLTFYKVKKYFKQLGQIWI